MIIVFFGMTSPGVWICKIKFGQLFLRVCVGGLTLKDFFFCVRHLQFNSIYLVLLSTSITVRRYINIAHAIRTEYRKRVF